MFVINVNVIVFGISVNVMVKLDKSLICKCDGVSLFLLLNEICLVNVDRDVLVMRCFICFVSVLIVCYWV